MGASAEVICRPSLGGKPVKKIAVIPTLSEPGTTTGNRKSLAEFWRPRETESIPDFYGTAQKYDNLNKLPLERVIVLGR